MIKKIIFTANLQDLRPLIWYGQPVYERYQNLYQLLSTGLGEQYAELMAEPVISNGKANWLSGWIGNGVQLTKLDPQRQEQVRAQMQQMLGTLKNFVSTLKASPDPHNCEMGELLEMSLEVPGLENVLVDGNKIVFVAWGFSSEKSFRENFKLDTRIAKPINPAVSDSVAISDAAPAMPEPPQAEPPRNDVQVSSNPEKKEENAQQTPPPPPPPPSDPKPGRKGMPGWLWFILGVIVALLLVFLLRDCSGCGDNLGAADNSRQDNGKSNGNNGGNNKNGDKGSPFGDLLGGIVPPPSGPVPPIDTTKIVVDPDDPGQRKVLSDKVNVALAKGVDLKAFGTKMYMKYRNDLKITYYDTAIKLFQLQVPDGEWKQWIAKLKEFPEVKLAFPNTLFSEGLAGDINDPDFSDREKAWYFDIVEAQQAWDITTGSEDVIVAVADNCFDLSHPELEGKIVNPYNVTTGDQNVGLVPGESNMHGTHVAGTAVGNSNNAGLCGIAPGCRLMPVQLADENGNMQSVSVMAGILYAIHHGAKVVNLSLGTYFGHISQAEQQELINNCYADETEFWNELFQFAIDEDCIVVLAAGNENILAGCDPFARSDKALVVSAFQPDERKPKADFSNHGKYANISAPGVHIYSSLPGNKFGYLDGTSMASPIVAGAAALMRSKYPDMKAQDIVSILRSTARPLESNPKIGPLLQIAQALNQAAEGGAPGNPDGQAK